MLWRIGLGALILGVILFVVGFFEWNTSKASSKAPERVSLQTVLSRGPAGNPNILLTDYRLCDNFVVEARSENSSWNKCWVPVVPASQAPPDGRPAHTNNVQALIFSTNVRNEGELNSRCQRPELRALITNRISSLGSKEKAILEKSYPGTDWSRCLIIQEGREPAGGLKLALMVGGGAISTLTGAGLLLWSLVQFQQESAARAKKRKKRRPVEEDEEEDEEPRPRKTRLASVEEDEEEPRPRKRRPVTEDEDEPRPRKRRPVAEEEEDEPRPRKRRPVDDDEDDEPRPRRRR